MDYEAEANSGLSWIMDWRWIQTSYQDSLDLDLHGELTSLGLPIMLPQFEGLIWILDLRLDLPIFWSLRLDLPIFWNLRLDLRCLCYSQDLRVSRECPLA